MKTTTNNTKNNTKASANKHNVSRETLTKNNMKVEGETMNTIFTKEVLEACKAHFTETTTLVNTKKAGKHNKGVYKETKTLLDKKFKGGVNYKDIEGVTDFDKLAKLIEYYNLATATKKAVRFTLKDGTRFSCWRRVNNIRVYTNNPEKLKIEWVEDTHEQGLTHSAYTSYITLAKLITNN